MDAAKASLPALDPFGRSRAVAIGSALTPVRERSGALSCPNNVAGSVNPWRAASGIGG